MRGKWLDQTTPKKGWDCVDWKDLGSLEGICEMCEFKEIRYVHIMSHPDYATNLEVGCVCAGYMAEDLPAAKEREAGMKSIAKKRSTWLERRWLTSASGNAEYINTDGFHISVWEYYGYWRGKVTDEETDYTRYSSLNYTNPDDLKLKAFDVMMQMKKRRSNDDDHN